MFYMFFSVLQFKGIFATLFNIFLNIVFFSFRQWDMFAIVQTSNKSIIIEDRIIDWHGSSIANQECAAIMTNNIVRTTADRESVFDGKH